MPVNQQPQPPLPQAVQNCYAEDVVLIQSFEQATAANPRSSSAAERLWGVAESLTARGEDSLATLTRPGTGHGTKLLSTINAYATYKQLSEDETQLVREDVLYLTVSCGRPRDDVDIALRHLQGRLPASRWGDVDLLRRFAKGLQAGETAAALEQVALLSRLVEWLAQDNGSLESLTEPGGELGHALLALTDSYAKEHHLTEAKAQVLHDAVRDVAVYRARVEEPVRFSFPWVDVPPTDLPPSQRS